MSLCALLSNVTEHKRHKVELTDFHGPVPFMISMFGSGSDFGVSGCSAERTATNLGVPHSEKHFLVLLNSGK